MSIKCNKCKKIKESSHIKSIICNECYALPICFNYENLNERSRILTFISDLVYSNRIVKTNEYNKDMAIMKYEKNKISHNIENYNIEKKLVKEDLFILRKKLKHQVEFIRLDDDIYYYIDPLNDDEELNINLLKYKNLNKLSENYDTAIDRLSQDLKKINLHIKNSTYTYKNFMDGHYFTDDNNCLLNYFQELIQAGYYTTHEILIKLFLVLGIKIYINGGFANLFARFDLFMEDIPIISQYVKNEEDLIRAGQSTKEFKDLILSNNMIYYWAKEFIIFKEKEKIKSMDLFKSYLEYEKYHNTRITTKSTKIFIENLTLALDKLNLKYIKKRKPNMHYCNITINKNAFLNIQNIPKIENIRLDFDNNIIDKNDSDNE